MTRLPVTQRLTGRRIGIALLWEGVVYGIAEGVLLPGAGSTRTAVLPQAAVLARHGYGALLLDTRGHGR
jgi:hypothetical protein